MKVGYNDRAVGGVSGPTKEQFYFTFFFYINAPYLCQH